MTNKNVIDLEKFRAKKNLEEEKSLKELIDYLNSLEIDTMTFNVDSNYELFDDFDMLDFYEVNMNVNLDLGDDDGS